MMVNAKHCFESNGVAAVKIEERQGVMKPGNRKEGRSSSSEKNEESNVAKIWGWRKGGREGQSSSRL